MDFKLYTSFVLGAPGETDDTLEETLIFIERVKSVMGDDLIMLGANILIPYPGTESFEMLIREAPQFIGQDILDPYELTRCWVEIFCNFSGPRRSWHERLLSVTEEVNCSAQSAVSLLGAKAGVH